MGYVVYGDVLLALNFFFDFFLLWFAGKFMRRRIRWLRLTAAALLGAAYGAGVAVYAGSFLYAWPAAAAVSVLLLRLAYPWQGWPEFCRLAAAFYLLAFAMAGAGLAAAAFLAQRGAPLAAGQAVRGAALLFALIPGFSLGQRGWRLLRRAWQKEDFLTVLEIAAAGRLLSVPALIDTGNNLCEPVSGLPVAVADYTALQGLFPQRLRLLLQRYGGADPAQILQSLARDGDVDGWWKRLRLIPFASIGKSHGLLLGFRPDKLTVISSEGRLTAPGVVALSFGELKDRPYGAVINPQLLQGGENIKEVGA
ncbi:MAG: sigma-E processing peptidase SpoIIGA [Firmicutes bacterium]|nr:sigma-E processing peptidase SpoIIGA [Bacillota bacterium]